MKDSSAAVLFALFFVLLAAACGRGDPSEEAGGETSASLPDTAGVPRAAAPAPADSAPTLGRSRLAGPDLIDIHYRLVGTEPFWALEMTRDGMAYNRAGGDSIAFPFGQLRRRPRVDIMRSSADGHEIEAEVRRERCSDGMSDRVYAFSAQVVIDGEELRGCAFEPPVKAPPVSESALRRAGLTGLVRAARRTRAEKADLRRVVGSLEDSTATGAAHVFAAFFAADTLRLIEARATRDGRTISEASYFFDAGPAGGPSLRLVDADYWSAPEDHEWMVVGFDPAGKSAGEMYQLDGVAAAVPPGLVSRQRAVAERLVNAALRSAARGLP